jgi:hypothetical protein
MAIVFKDWRNANKQRRYPFADHVAAANDAVAIPDNVFVDGRLYPIGGNAELFLSRITKDANSLIFAIRATGTAELATASFDLDEIPTTGEVAFFDTYGRPAGLLLSSESDLQGFSGIDAGVYEFLLTQTQFAASVVTPQPETCVRGIILEDGSIFTGDIWIVGENGVVLREENGAIRVDVIGDPFAARKLCEDEVTDDSEISALAPYCPIKRINNIAPDASGNYQLLVGANESLTNILRITPGDQADSTVTEHLEGAEALGGATLKIEALGQRRLRGDL